MHDNMLQRGGGGGERLIYIQMQAHSWEMVTYFFRTRYANPFSIDIAEMNGMDLITNCGDGMKGSKGTSELLRSRSKTTSRALPSSPSS
jgi:hypothetical protein